MYTTSTQKYEESVKNNSLWITATPSASALTLPFYIMEAGHFYAQTDYKVQRTHHESFLLLYTVKGEGTLHSGSSCLKLPTGSCAVIDCRTPHSYYISGESWDFLWLHFNGCGAAPLMQLLYPTEVQTIKLTDTHSFASGLEKLLKLTSNNDIGSCMESSAHMHRIFLTLFNTLLEREKVNQKDSYKGYIDEILQFIRENFALNITIDDMLQNIPISKYHFIRLFRRVMGVTPYNYLLNYRITRSKILLRSTQVSVAEIAESCGFLDTSNFIAQFKKQTGVRPTHYRKAFFEEQRM